MLIALIVVEFFLGCQFYELNLIKKFENLLTNFKKLCIIKIENKKPRKWLPKESINHSLVKAEWFIFYCLCSKKQMMINKATFMILSPFLFRMS